MAPQYQAIEFVTDKQCRICPARIGHLAGFVALIFIPVLIGNAGERVLDWMLL